MEEKDKGIVDILDEINKGWKKQTLYVFTIKKDDEETFLNKRYDLRGYQFAYPMPEGIKLMVKPRFLGKTRFIIKRDIGKYRLEVISNIEPNGKHAITSAYNETLDQTVFNVDFL